MLFNKTKNKVTVLANQNIEEWVKLGFNGKTLGQVDQILDGKLRDIGHGVNTTKDGVEINSLVLTFANRHVAFPLSKGLNEAPETLMEEDTLVNGVFYITKKRTEADGDDDEPTGAPYICFGRPSGIDIKITSLMSEKKEPVDE